MYILYHFNTFLNFFKMTKLSIKIYIKFTKSWNYNIIYGVYLSCYDTGYNNI